MKNFRKMMKVFAVLMLALFAVSFVSDFKVKAAEANAAEAEADAALFDCDWVERTAVAAAELAAAAEEDSMPIAAMTSSSVDSVTFSLSAGSMRLNST